jgi:membrane-associated phospholipid phosphatase
MSQPDPDSPSRETIGLRLAAMALAFGAAWLAGRVHKQTYTLQELPEDEDDSTARRLTRATASTVTWLGYPLVYVPIAWMIGRRLKEKGVDDANAVLESMALSWIAFHAAKMLIDRPRPVHEEGESDGESYPSGHTTPVTAVAAAAAYLWLRSDNERKAAVLLGAAVVPAAVGATRVLLRKHWPTDTVGGALIGMSAAAAVISRRSPAGNSALHRG